jgi:hypothetical protein
MLRKYELEYLDLQTLETPELALQIQAVMASMPQDLRLFEFDGIAFGKLCAFDLILATKIADLEHVSEVHRSGWLQYIQASLHAYLLVDRLCRQLPVARLVHFNDYSLLLSGRLAAQKHNVPSYGVTQASHMNVDRRRYIIVPTVMRASFVCREREWQNWRDYPVPENVVGGSTDDLLVRFGAKGRQSHVFSPSKDLHEDDIRPTLGLQEDRKVLVAYTSSLDETIAVRMYSEALGLPVDQLPQPFADQVEWLRALTGYVEASADLQLVVRVHPREGRRRGGVESQHLLRLKREFDRSFRHCVLVWPEMPISSYDLAEAADVALISWSSMGLELARLGVPVLACTQGIGYFPQDDFLEWGATPATYFDKLVSLLERPATLDTIARAVRWYHLFHLGASLDMGDLVPSFDFTGAPPFRMPAEARAIEDIIIGGQDIVALNAARLRAGQHERSGVDEAAALRRQFRRVIYYLYTGQDPRDDYTLLLRPGAVTADGLADIVSRTRNLDVKVLIAEGWHTRFIERGRVHTKYSAMVARLGPLCAQEMVPSPRPASALPVSTAGV